MGKRNRFNVLLMEILIAILFFMLSATVLVRVFAGARNLTVKAGVQTRALMEAQNVAEAVCAAEDVDAALAGLGFDGYRGVWTREYEDFTLAVSEDKGAAERTDAGVLSRYSVSASWWQPNSEKGTRQFDALFELPCTRYEEVQS